MSFIGGATLGTDKSFLVLFYKKEQCFFFAKKKQKTLASRGRRHPRNRCGIEYNGPAERAGTPP
jgi:hypothetical protein